MIHSTPKSAAAAAPKQPQQVALCIFDAGNRLVIANTHGNPRVSARSDIVKAFSTFVLRAPLVLPDDCLTHGAAAE
jgi:hypothetical protein